MRNSNAFVGNLCTINLPCSVSMTQISLISKRHSLNTACMDALTHPCKGPTSGLQTFIPPYPPKHSLLRDSPQVMSLTKKPTCIFVFSQSHTWDLLHFLFGSVGWLSSQTCSCPPVWRSYVLHFSLTAQLSLTLAQIKRRCPIEDEEVQPGAHTPQTGLLLIL